MEYKVYDCSNYKIHTIKTDKFKTCSMEIMFRKEIVKEDISKYNMLVDVLMGSSLKYKTRRDVSIKLEDLYCASIRGVTTRLGNSNLISFVLDFLNPKYCDDNYLDEVIDLPFEMLNNPNIVNGKFDERTFKIVYNRLKNEIESLYENPNRYALRRSLINMDSESVSSYSMLGDLDSLNEVTTSNLVDTYHELFDKSICDIYVIGNLDMNKVVDIIKDKFKINSDYNRSIDLYVEQKIKDKVLDVVESGKYEQDTFIMISNLVNLSKYEKDYVVRLFNVLFGSGGLTSKLYKYIREENSLCYTLNNGYNKFDSLLIMTAGIDKKNKDLVIELYDKALNEMINGDFTLDELNNAKKTMISSIKINEDSMGGIINNYLFYELDGTDLYDERIEKYKNITKEEIIKVAKKIKKNTIYMLTGEDK